MGRQQRQQYDMPSASQQPVPCCLFLSVVIRGVGYINFVIEHTNRYVPTWVGVLIYLGKYY